MLKLLGINHLTAIVLDQLRRARGRSLHPGEKVTMKN